MTTRTQFDQKSSEKQNKDIEHRIGQVEKNFGHLHKLFSDYMQKTAELADIGSQIRGALLEYSVGEQLNPTSSEALHPFVEHYGTTEIYRDALARRLEAKVVAPLQQYGKHCKAAKGNLKGAKTALAKEIKSQSQLSKNVQNRPSDRGKISKSQAQLQQDAVRAGESSKSLEDNICKFEQRKIQDLKQILQSFVHSELLFHAKALELFSKCYNSLRAIDPTADLETFMQSLVPNSVAARQQLARSVSATSLPSQRSNQAAPSGSGRPSPRTPQASTSRQQAPARPSGPSPRARTAGQSAAPLRTQEPEEESDEYDSNEYTDDDEYTYEDETETYARD